MSEVTSKDIGIEEAVVSEFLKKGLQGPRYSIAASHEEDPSSGPGGDIKTRSLTLEYGDKLSVEEGRILRHILVTNPSVKKLTIWEVSLSVFRTVFEDLEEPLSLEELVVLNIDFEGQNFCLRLSGIFRNLCVLDLRGGSQPSRNTSDDGGGLASSIADLLRDNTTLQELSLWCDELGDAGCSVLAKALTTNDTLKKLHIVDETLTSKTVVAFAETLVVNSALEKVDIFEVDMSEGDVSFLFEEDKYANTFKRLYILWRQKFLPQLTMLLREDRHCSDVSVDVTESVHADVLQDFLDAVAKSKTVRMLHFYPSGKTFDALADGLVSVLSRTTTITQIQNLMQAEEDGKALVKVLSALKDNNTVTDFMMMVEILSPEICRSLSEVLATNKTLSSVSICEYYGILPEQLRVILEGLRCNYTVTHLMVAWDPDDVEGVAEMEELLERNRGLLNKAAQFVKEGGDATDVEGADALKKVRSSPRLVEKLQEVTGKGKEAVLDDIAAAVTRVPC
ncbi:uncharacterized protein LOC144158417 isoform X2 [Haemaphysalis longicornis]